MALLRTHRQFIALNGVALTGSARPRYVALTPFGMLLGPHNQGLCVCGVGDAQAGNRTRFQRRRRWAPKAILRAFYSTLRLR
jgi:hypothetical protein